MKWMLIRKVEEMGFQEREIKFYIQDLPAVEQRLRVCGADLVRVRTLERNLRLDTPEGELQKADCLLRIREDDRVRVTYKDSARVEDGVIARTEIEVTCDDFSITRKLFEALGYRVVVMYEKYRTEYRIGDASVVLDEMPFGDFLEIEAPNNALIEGVVQMLGLDWSAGIGTNYLGLFETIKAKLSLQFNDLSFENFAEIEVKPGDLSVHPADQY